MFKRMQEISTHLGAVCKFMRRQVYFSKATLADEAAKRIVAYVLEIFRRELTEGYVLA